MACSKLRAGWWSRLRCGGLGLLTLALAAAGAQAVEIPAVPGGVTHTQVRRIEPADGTPGLMLKSFCLDAKGRLVTLLDGNDPAWGTIPTPGDTPGSPAAKPGCEVRIVDVDGKLVHKFPVDFSGHSVNVGPDGNIYVGGNGVVAKYDAQGKQLIRTDAPNMAAGGTDEEALRMRAKETLTEMTSAYVDALANLEKQKKEMEGKTDEELTEEQREIKLNLEPLIQAYQQMIEQRKAEPSEEEIRQTMESLASRQKTINAIAANDKYVFVTCAAPKGYGYVVWRTDLDFKNPTMTVEGLRGCCGQMDVQCCGEELVVAENARHRVVRFDADGKEVLAFGKRSRDGIGVGFGSCCNPMNTRLVGDKLYVAESDGTVKLFSQGGDFLSLLGKADVAAGCKSSIVAASPEGDRVFYFDVQRSAICVLERTADAAPATN